MSISGIHLVLLLDRIVSIKNYYLSNYSKISLKIFLKEEGDNEK
jgi:hypothetical protein